jgi:hypothetical protein
MLLRHRLLLVSLVPALAQELLQGRPETRDERGKAVPTNAATVSLLSADKGRRAQMELLFIDIPLVVCLVEKPDVAQRPGFQTAQQTTFGSFACALSLAALVAWRERTRGGFWFARPAGAWQRTGQHASDQHAEQQVPKRHARDHSRVLR